VGTLRFACFYVINPFFLVERFVLISGVINRINKRGRDGDSYCAATANYAMQMAMILNFNANDATAL
jgi:hypothetical protein